MRSIASALLDKGPALYLLSPLLPKSKLATPKGPGAEGLKDGTPFWLWAIGPKKKEKWALSFLLLFPTCRFRETKTHGPKAYSSIAAFACSNKFPASTSSSPFSPTCLPIFSDNLVFYGQTSAQCLTHLHEKHIELMPSYWTRCSRPPPLMILMRGFSKSNWTHNLANLPRVSVAVWVSILSTRPMALPRSLRIDGS